MLGKHRELADDLRQFVVLAAAEGEFHDPLVELLRLGDVLPVGGVLRRALRLQDVEREDHVVGGDRLAVVPARLRAQGEDRPRAVLGIFDGLGDQAVGGGGLVVGREHEAFVDLADGAGRRALEDEGVERIEGAAAGQAHQPALGGGGIDVFEVLGVGRIFEVAMGRKAVADDCAGRRLGPQDRRSADPKGQPACQHIAPFDPHDARSRAKLHTLYSVPELGRTMAAGLLRCQLLSGRVSSSRGMLNGTGVPGKGRPADLT